MSDPDSWGPVGGDIRSHGWEIQAEIRFRPMLGRYYFVTAFHPESGREIEVEAATLKIALKKIKKRIDA